MKKLLILSCVLAFCLTLAACHITDSADSSVPSGIPGSAIANESSAHQTESESSLEESRISQDTTVTSDPTENETTAPAKPADPMSTTEPESEKAPESTTPPQTEPETEPAEPPSESAKAYAGAEDARAVADKVLEYINSFRTSPAVKLPGLTSYAEYRSRQLIRNFAHDTNDERAAATALQYGEYVDPSVYGGSGTTVPMPVKRLQRPVMSVRWTKLPISWRPWSETVRSTGAISARPSMAILPLA